MLAASSRGHASRQVAQHAGTHITLNTTICCSVKGNLLGPYSASAALLVLAAPFSCMHGILCQAAALDDHACGGMVQRPPHAQGHHAKKSFTCAKGEKPHMLAEVVLLAAAGAILMVGTW